MAELAWGVTLPQYMIAKRKRCREGILYYLSIFDFYPVYSTLAPPYVLIIPIRSSNVSPNNA